jgi:hypothetical protein
MVPYGRRGGDVRLPSQARPGQTRREAGTQSQGSSRTNEERPVAGPTTRPPIPRGMNVKANLARFTMAVALLASMALTLGAGMRWY